MLLFIVLAITPQINGFWRRKEHNSRVRTQDGRASTFDEMILFRIQINIVKVFVNDVNSSSKKAIYSNFITLIHRYGTFTVLIISISDNAEATVDIKIIFKY